MTREQLERLGEAGLRQVARRLGLRGARQHDRALLITGLTAYFARHTDLDDADLEPDDEADHETELHAAEIPPALTTETMARLLESQGQATRASALRARIAHATPPPTTSSTAAAPAVYVQQQAPNALELVWEGVDFDEPGLVVRLWTDHGAPTHWELPLTAPRGRMRFDPPPQTTRLCAALGRLSPAGFRPVVRSAIISLVDP